MNPAATTSPAANVASSPAPRVHRLHVIEIARGVASLWVLLFHSLTSWPAEALHPFLAAVQKLTQPGWLGVHMFFAISGWCIAERLAAAQRRDESCGAFLRERALRIYPLYWIAFALLLVSRMAAYPFNSHTSFAQNLPADAGVWIADLLLIHPYVNAPATLMVSWSLVYELGFYALGAGALLLRRRGVSATVIFALGLLLCAWPLTQLHFRATHILGLWPDFFAGVLVWWCAREAGKARTLIGIGALLALTALTLAWEPYGGTGRLAALATAALLWIASRRDFVPTSGLARSLTWLGLISYSLYLVHVIVLSPFMNLGQRLVSPQSFAFVFVWAGGVAASIVGSWLVHRYAEAPIERWRKRRWSPRARAIAP